MATHGTCSLCGRPAAGPTVDPGPDLGRVHRSCFIAWDREAEAFERAEATRPHTYGREPVREALRA